MSTTDLELIYDTPQATYDPFTITISWMDGRLDDGPRWIVEDWSFYDDNDKQQYNNILADGVDKAELDSWIESRINESDPPE